MVPVKNVDPVIDSDELFFSLRYDRNGLRPVFALGNTQGRCSYNCRFCGVKSTHKTTKAESKQLFHNQWSRYQPMLDTTYHPTIYNKGNITNPAEFPRELLFYILNHFRKDERVAYVSLNSRERDADEELLRQLIQCNYPFRIHFIFGLESASSKSTQILGKDTTDELELFTQKISFFNRQTSRQPSFGLDVNLVFLPELYLHDGEQREGQDEAIQQGLEQDVRHILSLATPQVPIQINIHPYYHVAALPFAHADLKLLVSTLPRLQSIINTYNSQKNTDPIHLFIGNEGKGYTTEYWQKQLQDWGDIIEQYNTSGLL